MRTSHHPNEGGLAEYRLGRITAVLGGAVVTSAHGAAHYELGQLSPRLAGVRLAVNASNLTDQRYVASCFNDSFGCSYGERRRVLASLRVRW